MKWYGKIGYSSDVVETKPGIWEEQLITRSYFGESYKNTRMLQNSGMVNDNINVGLQISIVADPYALQNFHTMRYVEYMGSNWKVTSVDVQYPRLILTVGGLYNNGETI